MVRDAGRSCDEQIGEAPQMAASKEQVSPVEFSPMRLVKEEDSVLDSMERMMVFHDEY